MSAYATLAEARDAGQTEAEQVFSEHPTHLVPEMLILDRLLRRLTWGNFKAITYAAAYAEGIQQVLDTQRGER